MTKIIPTDKARQGRTGRHLLLILICGLLLALVIWGLVEIYGKAIAPANSTTAIETSVTLLQHPAWSAPAHRVQPTRA